MYLSIYTQLQELSEQAHLVTKVRIITAGCTPHDLVTAQAGGGALLCRRDRGLQHPAGAGPGRGGGAGPLEPGPPPHNNHLLDGVLQADHLRVPGAAP